MWRGLQGLEGHNLVAQHAQLGLREPIAGRRRRRRRPVVAGRLRRLRRVRRRRGLRRRAGDQSGHKVGKLQTWSSARVACVYNMLASPGAQQRECGSARGELYGLDSRGKRAALVRTCGWPGAPGGCVISVACCPGSEPGYGRAGCCAAAAARSGCMCCAPGLGRYCCSSCCSLQGAPQLRYCALLALEGHAGRMPPLGAAVGSLPASAAPCVHRTEAERLISQCRRL